MVITSLRQYSKFLRISSLISYLLYASPKAQCSSLYIKPIPFKISIINAIFSFKKSWNQVWLLTSFSEEIQLPLHKVNAWRIWILSAGYSEASPTSSLEGVNESISWHNWPEVSGCCLLVCSSHLYCTEDQIQMPPLKPW